MNYINLLYLLQFFVFVTPKSNEDTVCEELLNTFSDATANFTSCAIANSRPITLCENCVESYINVIDSYKNMSHVTENNEKCIDNYINLDRLQIVETLYKNSYDLWKRAKCNDCFRFDNSTLTPHVSNETLQFDEYYLDLVKCINTTNKTEPADLCISCLENYITLNNYYISISDENEIGVCMDIVDLMNTTRRYWSKKCCQYRKHSEYIFLGTAGGIFVITAFFYILTNCFGEKKIPAILQQSRFAESLNHMNREIDSKTDSDS